MIAFLDNQSSVGKESELAQLAARRKREFGINENLAREILELHTLGVHGGYTQADVTSFAEIITGWSIGGGKGRLAGGILGRFYFRDNLHEPGAKIFDKTYREEGRRQGEAVLEDLAEHPATAHFIGTAGPAFHRRRPAARRHQPRRQGLPQTGVTCRVYATLVQCLRPDPDVRKFKTPEDFVFSTLRALDISPRRP